MLDSVTPPVEQEPAPLQTVSANPGSAAREPVTSKGATKEEDATKQALAADLEDMIGGMLRTTQFATAATAKTRSWSRQMGQAALDAASEASAITPSSLVVDLARSRPAPAPAPTQPATQRHRWIDAVLVLACVLSVLSAGYFTLTP